ncbi:uncharacterized protein At4g08330, chloroplastic [Cryptomeria japonica]|uniref:uncharacterized protein At4g08330, chloroplastic n=1 Tax=Cryptomeria japonica TaxID=3369 RepID=UPI0025AC9151|nr:uncharacterized protein At4g08330, chloroplastic [Cryptomeria japonica]
MSQADVTYSCGSCGYPLNLCSSNRITSNIGSEYRKAIKKGIISFLSIDLSRFTQVDEVKCALYSCGFCRMRTKLLCRKCGTFIGYGYEDRASPCGFDSSDSSSSSGTPGRKKFNIKIRALQPSDETDVPQLAREA